jgi:hypothetical protein
MGAVGPFVLRRADGKYYAGSHQVRSGNIVPQWNVSSKWAHQYQTEQEARDASEHLKTRFGVETSPLNLGT